MGQIFTPFFIAKTFLPSPPIRLCNPLFQSLFQRFIQKHPTIFDRLENYDGQAINLDFLDQSFLIHLKFCGKNTKAHLFPDGQTPPKADATIYATTEVFISLLNGSQDGDMLFFNRHLTFIGKTELVVALRNCLDNENLCLEDELISLIPMSKNWTRSMLKSLSKSFLKATEVLETFQTGLTHETHNRQKLHQREITAHEELLKKLQQDHRKFKQDLSFLKQKTAKLQRMRG